MFTSPPLYDFVSATTLVYSGSYLMTSVMYGHLDVSNDLSMKRIITSEAFAHLPRPIAALHLCRIYSLPDTKLVIHLSCTICPKGVDTTPIFIEIRV